MAIFGAEGFGFDGSGGGGGCGCTGLAFILALVFFPIIAPFVLVWGLWRILSN
jgi:hypothetical protein